MRVMHDWEKALFKFLEKWIDRKDVIGIVLVGSYAVGNPSAHSDIDVHIILSDDVKWRERGNLYIDGFLIEYFANPIHQLRKYQEDGLKVGRKTDPRMFATGKVILDKTGAARKFQQESRNNLQKKFKKLDKARIETAKYTLWDQLDDMKDVRTNKSSHFLYLYSLQLETLLTVYARFLGAEIPARAKLPKFFNDIEYRDKYNIQKFPDRKFVEHFMDCLYKANFAKLERITNYVLDKMGGFNIDGWKLKTPAE